MSRFDIVKDSSVWINSSNLAALNKTNSIYLGVVKKAYTMEETKDIGYLVEIKMDNIAFNIPCRMMRRFGGVFNYEDYIMHGYKFDDKPDPVSMLGAKAGDRVVVGLLNGNAREGIILGSLKHHARIVAMDVSKGPQYKSEFNGIETIINENGEFKLTFRALPKNIKKLDEKPKSILPKPEYDVEVGGSYLQFDKTGSIELNDKAKEDPQSFKIDKKAGTIEILGGKVSLKITKKTEQIDIKNKITSIVSETKIDLKTKEFKTDASKSIKLKAPKIAIGKDGVELLEQLGKLIEQLGQVKPISPLGPCTPLMATPEWPQVQQIQQKIKEITGSL